MKWKYCMGCDDSGTLSSTYTIPSCLLNIFTFGFNPLLIIWFLTISVKICFLEPLSKQSAVPLDICVSFGVVLSSLFLCELYFLSYTNWYYTKFQLSSEGIFLESLFKKRRLIGWNSIQRAAIYNTYWGRSDTGVPFILVFLDLEKKPLELYGDRDCYRKRKYLVMIYVIEENVKEFELYWGMPLEKGVQKRTVYWI